MSNVTVLLSKKKPADALPESRHRPSSCGVWDSQRSEWRVGIKPQKVGDWTSQEMGQSKLGILDKNIIHINTYYIYVYMYIYICIYVLFMVFISMISDLVSLKCSCLASSCFLGGCLDGTCLLPDPLSPQDIPCRGLIPEPTGDSSLTTSGYWSILIRPKLNKAVVWMCFMIQIFPMHPYGNSTVCCGSHGLLRWFT